MDSFKYNVLLSPLPSPVPVISDQFCFPSNAKLLIKTAKNVDSIANMEIKDVKTDALLFKIAAKSDWFSSDYFLHDCYGKDILKMSCALDHFLIFLNDTRVGFVPENSAKRMFKTVGTFATLSQQPIDIVVKGSSDKFGCTMWIGEPKDGGIPVAMAICIAKTSGFSYKTRDYELKVAAGMNRNFRFRHCFGDYAPVNL